MLPAETAAGPVALPLGEQPSCGNDRQLWDSMHVRPAGCSRLLQNQNVVIVNCSIGHGRVWTCLP